MTKDGEYSCCLSLSLGLAWSHRGLVLTVGERHPDDVEGEVDGNEEEGEVGDGDAELEGSSVLEIEEGRHGTPGAARGEAGEVEAGGDAKHNEPAEHSKSEGIFLNRILI